MSPRMVLLECGHVVNAYDRDHNPACVICWPRPEAALVKGVPDLTGRVARCTCGKEVPSSLSLAFFEHRGEGSHAATDICAHCRYAKIAHEQDDTPTQANVILRGKCQGFEAHGEWNTDLFYCGHAGWD